MNLNYLVNSLCEVSESQGGYLRGSDGLFADLVRSEKCTGSEE